MGIARHVQHSNQEKFAIDAPSIMPLAYPPSSIPPKPESQPTLLGHAVRRADGKKNYQPLPLDLSHEDFSRSQQSERRAPLKFTASGGH